MSAVTPAGTQPYYFVPAPSAWPALTAAGLGQGQSQARPTFTFVVGSVMLRDQHNESIWAEVHDGASPTARPAIRA